MQTPEPKGVGGGGGGHSPAAKGVGESPIPTTGEKVLNFAYSVTRRMHSTKENLLG
jgi:hypothetical protein